MIRSLLALTGLLLACPDASAQVAPAPLELAKFRQRVHRDEPAPGEHWVRTPSYKARIDGRGLQYTPFLGADAPRNMPLGLRLVAVRAGGQPLEVMAEASATLEGDTYTVDRGAAQAHFRPTLEGVWQSFTLPAGLAGEVELELAVETDLVHQRQGGAHLWSCELGSVRYGEATAFDGAGQSVRVPVHYEGGRLRLSVPAPFVDRAEGPILVDPLISTFDVDVFFAELTAPRLTYEPLDDAYMIVYEEDFSAVDTDIFASWVSATSNVVRGAGYVELGADRWLEPDVAHNLIADVHMVVASNEYAPGQFAVWGRTLESGSTFQLNAPFLIESYIFSLPEGFVIDRPRIAGASSFAGGDSFGVIYQSEYPTDRDLIFECLGPDGTTRSRVAIEGTGSNDTHGGTIAEADEVLPGVDPGSWKVIHAESPTAGGQAVLRCQVLNGDGTPQVPPYTVTTLPIGDRLVELEATADMVAADPASGEPFFGISWRAEDGPTSSDQRVALCSRSDVFQVVDLTRLEHAEAADRRVGGVLASGARTFAHASIEQRAGGVESLVVTSLVPVGDRLAVGERRTEVDAGSIRSVGAASTYPAQSGLGDFMLAYSISDGSNDDIWAGRLFPPSFLVAGAQYCYGAPNSTGVRGFLEATGNTATNSIKTLIASDVPPGQFGFPVVSLTRDFVPNLGGGQGTLCLGAAIGRMRDQLGQIAPDGTLTMTVFPDRIQTPSGTVPAMAGEEWHFQLWHRDLAGGTATSNFTNAVVIPFD